MYFEKAYGEFVRLEPPMRGVNWLVWLSPVAFLIVGFLFVRVVVRRISTSKAEPGNTAKGLPEPNPSVTIMERRLAALEGSDQAPLSAAERAELHRLRKLVAEQEKDIAFLGKAAAYFASNPPKQSGLR